MTKICFKCEKNKATGLFKGMIPICKGCFDIVWAISIAYGTAEENGISIESYQPLDKHE